MRYQAKRVPINKHSVLAGMVASTASASIDPLAS